MVKIKGKDFFFHVKWCTIIFGTIGLILGIIYSFGGLLIDILVTLDIIISTETPGLSYGSILAFGALIVMPILFVIIGFFVGGVGVVPYNIIANFFPKSKG